MAKDREYELKFTLDPADAERVVAHPLLRPALRDRQVGHLVSTYFDTPDLSLQRHRFGLRVRRADDGVVHTLKKTGTSFVDRGEWERADAAPYPNIVWLRQTPLAPLLHQEGVATALAARFTVDATRTTLPLRHRGADIEVALDQGAIKTGSLSLPLHELELEAKTGGPEAVLALARALVRDLPLTLSLASKSERGYGLGDLTWGHPSQAITPALGKRMTIAEAFEAIVQACLHTFLKNVALVGGETDGEAVHKGRIALRHLRAVCQLFKPALRRKRFAGLRRDIKWLSDRLGAARDADVFQGDFFDPAARRSDVPGATALAGLMGENRRRAHQRLRKALASPRARLLFVDLLAFSSDGVRRGVRHDRFRPFARSVLKRRRHALARRARGIAHQSSAEMHEVRKAAKMLRYDLGLVGDVHTPGTGKTAARLKATLKTLQKSLGLIHDEEAMREHLRTSVLARPLGKALRSSGERRQAMFAAAHLASRPVRTQEHLRAARKAARRL